MAISRTPSAQDIKCQPEHNRITPIMDPRGNLIFISYSHDLLLEIIHHLSLTDALSFLSVGGHSVKSPFPPVDPRSVLS